jgi:hypothetical protein
LDSFPLPLHDFNAEFRGFERASTHFHLEKFIILP